MIIIIVIMIIITIRFTNPEECDHNGVWTGAGFATYCHCEVPEKGTLQERFKEIVTRNIVTVRYLQKTPF